MFAVLTGVNGAGKTQLFNAILDGYKSKNDANFPVLVEFNEESDPHVFPLSTYTLA